MSAVTSDAAGNAAGEAGDDPADGSPLERRDLFVWAILVGAGLLVTWLAVQVGAALGTRSAPFLGSYRFNLGLPSLLAPIVASGVLLAVRRGVLRRLTWPQLLGLSWAASLAWSLSLAVVDGEAGLTRSLQSPDNYLHDLPAVGDHPLEYLRSFTDNAAGHSIAARGHPPGPVLLLWALERLGLTNLFALGVLLASLGAAFTPVVLTAVRGVCGEPAARRYAPVLALAPYAVWVAVSVDVVVAVLGASMVAMGVRASMPTRAGLRSAGWALASGIALGFAALFSYAAPWLGLSVVCLYFARRRAFLNLATGAGALLPVLLAGGAGFSWINGLWVARDDYAARVGPYRSAWWWAAISLVVLLLAAGPALVRSAARLRNTPGWPFLVGAGVAIAFSLLFGLARGGVEAAWLPLFGWLTVAAVAPRTQGGAAAPSPLLLVGVGALAAIIIEATLATPW